MGGKQTKFAGLYFLLLSVIVATAFYYSLDLVFHGETPFFSITLFPIFIIVHILLTIIIYGISFKNHLLVSDPLSLLRIRTTIFILVCALIVSVIFPATGIFGLYPVSMAIIHLLILFYAGISFGAVILTGLFFLWRNGTVLIGPNKYIFIIGIILSIGISYATLYIFGQLPIN